jgi:hypothetical protein
MIFSLLFLTVLNIHLRPNNVPQQTNKSVDNVDIIQEITHGSKTDKLFVSDKVKHILWTIKFIRQ